MLRCLERCECQRTAQICMGTAGDLLKATGKDPKVVGTFPIPRVTFHNNADGNRRALKVAAWQTRGRGSSRL